jgi:putative alpha-1,2-mannosidase
VFDKVTIQLQPQYYTGKEFIVTAKNNSDSTVYVQKMKLNRTEYKEYSIDHSDITRGGTFELEMGNSAVKK